MAYIFSSPGKYIQGKGEIENIGKYASLFGKKCLFIVGSATCGRYKDVLDRNADLHEIEIQYGVLDGEPTYSAMRKFEQQFKDAGCEVIVGVGGGKALDCAKGTANYCDAPLIIVPTSAASDAPCSSLSVVYKEDGVMDSLMFHKRNPDVVLVDSQIIAEAPPRLLAAGMGDCLSTKFESRLAADRDIETNNGGRATLTAVMLGQLCYDVIMKDGLAAYKAVQNKVVTKALEKVTEANIYLSGVGAEGTVDGTAHGVYNALTIIPKCRKYMHGELVSFGTIVQLVLEDETEEQINEVIDFNRSVGLPVCLADIGLSSEDTEDLKKVAEAAVEDTASNHPFDVTAEDLYAAMIVADAMGRERK